MPMPLCSIAFTSGRSPSSITPSDHHASLFATTLRSDRKMARARLTAGWILTDCHLDSALACHHG